jgi:hypothetical protein
MSTPAAPPQVTGCDDCHLADTRGKHHIMTGWGPGPEPGQLVMLAVSYHFACCQARGCPDGTCPEALAAEESRLLT